MSNFILGLACYIVSITLVMLFFVGQIYVALWALRYFGVNI